jgi:membrane-associated protease RseP (regulator of RpoE activity)
MGDGDGEAEQRGGRSVEFGPFAASGTAATLVALWAWIPAVPVVLAGLTGLVLLHEGGHLLAARRTGMRATEYFAGFGPVVLAWRTRSGLRVGLKAIPAGGYVKVTGMTRREEVDPAHEAETFRAASRPRRLAVVAAGPVANLALGLLLLVLAAAFDPFPDQAGGAASAVRTGWDSAATVTTGTLDGMGRLVTDLDGYVATMRDPGDRADEAPTRFLSPIGVAQISDDVVDLGGWNVVRLVGIVSIGLGVMNLLPLPPLDGGHAAVVGVEWVASKLTRRPQLRLDVASPGIAMLTAATLVFVLGLGASAVVLDVASPISL